MLGSKKDMVRPSGTEDGYRFNDDLLLRQEDRDLARRLYPAIAYALDHPELREWLERIDPVANAAKRRSRVCGSWAVALVSGALFLASAAPLYEGDHNLEIIISALSGLLGVVGAFIGFFGVLHAKSKREWLENRLLTERMRLFHFGTIVHLSDLILTGQEDLFLERRSDLFKAFERDVLERPALELDALLEGEETRDNLSVVIAEFEGPVDQSAGKQLIDAYRRLRIGRQIDFAQYKLTLDRKLFSGFPRRQAYLLSIIATTCVLGLVLAHGVALLDVAFMGGELLRTWPHIVGVWLAISALALRTLQEGFQPNQEVERYRHYRTAIRAAADNFEAEPTSREKLQAARAVERASADEMVIFLRANSEARFVM